MVKRFGTGRLLPLNDRAVAILDFGLAYFHYLSLVISFSLRNAMELLELEQPSLLAASIPGALPDRDRLDTWHRARPGLDAALAALEPPPLLGATQLRPRRRRCIG